MRRIKGIAQRRRHRQGLEKPEKTDHPDKIFGAPPQTQSESITYRIRCLPTRSTFASTKALLENVLDVGENMEIIICSLAKSKGYGGAKTAIMRTKNCLPKLQGPQNQWKFRISDETNDSEQDRIQSHEIVIDTHFEGLTPFNSFDDELKHEINVVAITGLAGHAFRSFKDYSSDFMWLMDALPSDLEGAQIWTYGYDTKLVDSSSFQDLEALASTFRRSLMSLAAPPDRKVVPLVFIGHSLGGLILKEVLVQMSNDPNAQAASLYQATYGLLLFGCPNQGMDVSSLIPMCEGQVNLPFLFDLGRSSERLRQLCRAFPKAFAFPDSRIISFYETKLSPTAIEKSPGVWKMEGPLAVLVDISSATHSRPEEIQAHDIHGINRTHSELVKLGRQDLDYNVILGFLQEFKLAAPSVINMRIRRGMIHDANSKITSPEQQLKRSEICKWLAPVDSEQGCDHYLEDFDDARFLRHPGTCEWIKPRLEYEKWSTCKFGSQSSLLWIHAIPGAGKTVLASYLVDSAIESNPSAVIFFFFKNGDSDKNTAVAALRSFIYQILQHSENTSKQAFYDDLQQCKENAAHLRAVNIRQLWEVFTKYCLLKNGLVIILDALDECGDVIKLLPNLLRLASTAQVKVAFTSRREPELTEALQGVPSLAMGPEDVSDDIKVYLNSRVAKSSNLSDPRVRSRITRILNNQSKGMFLWVRLMVDELESCVTITQIEGTLSSLPEGLPEVYQRILRRLQTSLKQARRDFCSKLLKWLVLAKRPLRLREVNEALRLEYAGFNGGPAFSQNLLCSDRDVESICGSLVTVKKQIIELIHLSAKEFLLVPAGASTLSGGLEDFLVDVDKDSAGVASLCTTYLRSKQVAREISPTEAKAQAFNHSYPLVEYACFHWISHITDANANTMADRNIGLRDFIISRHPFFWIEKYFTFRRHSKSELYFDIQRLLDWATVDDVAVSVSCSTTHFLSLFSAWSQAFLRLLDEYGAMLEFQPGLVHQIDPRRFFHSADSLLLEALCEDAGIQQYCTVRAATKSTDSPSMPEHRKLPKLTDSDVYALCYFDKKRNAVFTVEAAPGKMPRFHCQEITTGRKLMPVVDKEFIDNDHPIIARAAAMSQGADFLAIQYDWDESRYTQLSYTVVWALDSDLKFEQRRRTSWAQKVFSNINAIPELDTMCMAESKRLITFDEDGNLQTQRGQIEIATGQEMPFPSSIACDPSALTLSGNGKVVILDAFGSDLRYITQDEGTKMIPDSASSVPGSFHDISHTGRFVVCEVTTEEDFLQAVSTDIKVMIFDTHTEKTINFVIPSQQETQYGITKPSSFWFAEDESKLFGLIPKRFVAFNQSIDGNSETFILYVWKRYGTGFTLWGSKPLYTGLLGHFYDTEAQHLYIVEPGPAWNRIDLTTSDLCDLNEDVSSMPIRYKGLSHRVSSGGSYIATLGSSHSPSQLAIEFFKIDTTSRVLNIVPSMLERSIGLYLFSPDLEYLFIQSFIIAVRSSEPRIMAEGISRNMVDDSVSSSAARLQYDFSPDSSYFAFSSYLTSLHGGRIQLRIWSMAPDRNSFVPYALPEKFDSNSPECILGDYNMAGFDFHPQSTLMILSLWRKLALLGTSESWQYTMTCFILDLSSAELTELEPTSCNSKQVLGQLCLLPNETDFVARFSVDGSYAVLDPGRGAHEINHSHRFGVFYKVPMKFEPISPPLSFLDKDIFQPWWHENGLSFRIRKETCGDEGSVIAICLSVAKGKSLEKMILTYLPEYSRHASVTVMAAERGQKKGQQRLRILLWRDDGGIEIIHTNKTLLDVLEGSKLWKKHGERELKEKDLRLERLEDTDSEVEEQGRHKSEGSLVKSA